MDIATGNVTDGYTMAQHFVGGGLSAYAGSAYATKATGGKGLNMFGKSTKTVKLASKFVEYGVQASAADFAYKYNFNHQLRKVEDATLNTKCKYVLGQRFR
jgi:hypothetical protein